MGAIVDRTGLEGSALLGWTSEIVAAYASKNPMKMSDAVAMIRHVHDALQNLADRGTEPQGADGSPRRPHTNIRRADTKEPVVPISQSIGRDYIVCLEDGKKLRTLRRYLRTHYNMSPEEYRERWGLPPDYPMVSPSYAELRSAVAKKMGFGHVGRPANSDMPKRRRQMVKARTKAR